MASKRGYYKEELRRAIDNIEMSLTHLTRVVEAYSKGHEEISNPVLECGNALVLIAETIAKIEESI